MPCNCGSGKGGKASYTAKFADGTKKTFSTETEAKAAVLRKGGTVVTNK